VSAFSRDDCRQRQINSNKKLPMIYSAFFICQRRVGHDTTELVAGRADWFWRARWPALHFVNKRCS